MQVTFVAPLGLLGVEDPEDDELVVEPEELDVDSVGFCCCEVDEPLLDDELVGGLSGPPAVQATAPKATREADRA